MPRLFVALEVPPDIATALAAIRGGLPGARWIDPENYHLTLRFIGDIDDAMARDVHAALEEIRFAPFGVNLTGLAAFGHAKPRAVVMAAKLDAALGALHAEQERQLRRIGLAPEPRKFMPHVTLARLRHSTPFAVAEYLAMQGPFSVHAFQATRFALFSARDSVGGGPYIMERVYSLV